MVIFSLAGSWFCAANSFDPGQVGNIASFITLLAGAATVLLNFQWNWKACFGAMIIGATSEIFGVYTGWPFGRYDYTENWWPTVTLPARHTYPLLLPIAWAMLVGACWGGTRAKCKAAYMIVATAIFATLADASMEGPMTLAFKYWHWRDLSWPIDLGWKGEAPLLNWVGWFGVTVAVALVFNGLQIKIVSSWECRAVLAGHLALTLGVAALRGYTNPTGYIEAAILILLFSAWVYIAEWHQRRTHSATDQ